MRTEKFGMWKCSERFEELRVSLGLLAQSLLQISGDVLALWWGTLPESTIRFVLNPMCRPGERRQDNEYQRKQMSKRTHVDTSGYFCR